jgi:hypothetical protein
VLGEEAVLLLEARVLVLATTLVLTLSVLARAPSAAVLGDVAEDAGEIAVAVAGVAGQARSRRARSAALMSSRLWRRWARTGADWGRGTLIRALREIRNRAPLVWSYDVETGAPPPLVPTAPKSLSPPSSRSSAPNSLPSPPASRSPRIPLPSPLRPDEKTTKTRARPQPPA